MEEKNNNNLDEEIKNLPAEETENNIAIPPESDEAASQTEDTAQEQTTEEAEEKVLPDIPEPPAVTPTEEKTAVYAYRWDYSEQYLQDKKRMNKGDTRGVRNFAIVMSIAFLLSIITLVGVLFMDISVPSADTNGSSLDALYEECYPSYVALSVMSKSGVAGAGSGIVMTQDGYIATNYHVVDEAKSITVILHNGKSVDAEYIDGDELNDIAIIKIDEKRLTPAVIGSSASTRVGEQVMAIGTPYSIQYRGTMTSGYISALDRKYAAKNENGTTNKVITLLQTDTSVNPGNSGGPLFNMDGEVIGIVSMKIAGSEYEGMGFAIPIDGVIDMLLDIIEHGELTIENGGSAFEGAALGITVETVEKDTTYFYSGDYRFIVETDANGEQRVLYTTRLGVEIPIPLSDTELLEEYDIAEYTLYTAPASGCRIVGITPNFDAAKHLKIDDIIVKANGVSCEYKENLGEIVANCRVGDTLELEVSRGGETIWLTIRLGRAADTQTAEETEE